MPFSVLLQWFLQYFLTRSLHWTHWNLLTPLKLTLNYSEILWNVSEFQHYSQVLVFFSVQCLVGFSMSFVLLLIELLLLYYEITQRLLTKQKYLGAEKCEREKNVKIRLNLNSNINGVTHSWKNVNFC